MLNFSHNVQESGLYTYLYSRNPSLTCSSRSLPSITEKDFLSNLIIVTAIESFMFNHFMLLVTQEHDQNTKNIILFFLDFVLQLYQ